jgi:hypothetical protein
MPETPDTPPPWLANLDLLTADEIEALLRSVREDRSYFRSVCAHMRPRPLTEAEIAARENLDRAGEAWWDKRLAEMRAEEAERKQHRK